MKKIKDAEKIIIGGDLNGHVEGKKGGFERVLGKYIKSQKNDEGLDILIFCQTFDLMIPKSIFAKLTDKLVTFMSRDSKSQTDFILTRKKHIFKIRLLYSCRKRMYVPA